MEKSGSLGIYCIRLLCPASLDRSNKTRIEWILVHGCFWREPVCAAKRMDVEANGQGNRRQRLDYQGLENQD
jgi:hypothetical protein